LPSDGARGSLVPDPAVLADGLGCFTPFLLVSFSAA